LALIATLTLLPPPSLPTSVAPPKLFPLPYPTCPR
jgi:hypothetical protein